MEDLLLQIVKEASSTKLSLLRKSAQEAHGMLYYHSRWKLSDLLQVHAVWREILCYLHTTYIFPTPPANTVSNNIITTLRDLKMGYHVYISWHCFNYKTKGKSVCVHVLKLGRESRGIAALFLK
jgi:hypothetical protein